MNPLPDPALAFLLEHHVLSLAVCQGREPWAASVFYALDVAVPRFIILSDTRTRHGGWMLENAQVAGTVAGQPLAITEIRGVQFQGVARLLEGDAESTARALYDQCFPQARGMAAPVWEITLRHLKYTDNRAAFAAKLRWEA
ncbi:MAG: pyridoxamine 5'-phosphate oxidase family protein [Azospirillaceae bacterium]|nr:pyridoxamine 5'-phosphate oxidase family protein [Azospirillaceae bacterium]